MADFTELAGNPLSDEPVLSPRTEGQCWPKMKVALHSDVHRHKGFPPRRFAAQKLVPSKETWTRLCP
eukprot:CAMPEP_0198707304 /NCGR_PEP_ID=MMETSP1468-20131203/391320_1 /TAXON_ID=1461545 /ORGANISM="Mantoniella sp, Strain CCMP1436" /LENGTH=66 /DNA_ID=CAMNT_0044466271 /DNA_START=370 /DNA_END=570 /DNA_ORIENTATION=+